MYRYVIQLFFRILFFFLQAYIRHPMVIDKRETIGIISNDCHLHGFLRFPELSYHRGLRFELFYHPILPWFSLPLHIL
jgi:hypothetical protein